MSSDEIVQLIVGWGRFKRSINRIELDCLQVYIYSLKCIMAVIFCVSISISSLRSVCFCDHLIILLMTQGENWTFQNLWSKKDI